MSELSREQVERAIGSIGRRDYRDPHIQKIAKEALARKKKKSSAPPVSKPTSSRPSRHSSSSSSSSSRSSSKYYYIKPGEYEGVHGIISERAEAPSGSGWKRVSKEEYERHQTKAKEYWESKKKEELEKKISKGDKKALEEWKKKYGSPKTTEVVITKNPKTGERVEIPVAKTSYGTYLYEIGGKVREIKPASGKREESVLGDIAKEYHKSIIGKSPDYAVSYGSVKAENYRKYQIAKEYSAIREGKKSVWVTPENKLIVSGRRPPYGMSEKVAKERGFRRVSPENVEIKEGEIIATIPVKTKSTITKPTEPSKSMVSATSILGTGGLTGGQFTRPPKESELSPFAKKVYEEQRKLIKERKEREKKIREQEEKINASLPKMSITEKAFSIFAPSLVAPLFTIEKRSKEQILSYTPIKQTATPEQTILDIRLQKTQERAYSYQEKKFKEWRIAETPIKKYKGKRTGLEPAKYGVVEFGKGVARSIITFPETILHTPSFAIQTATNPVKAGKQIISEFTSNPAGFIGEITGTAIVTEGIGKGIKGTKGAITKKLTPEGAVASKIKTLKLAKNKYASVGEVAIKTEEGVVKGKIKTVTVVDKYGIPRSVTEVKIPKQKVGKLKIKPKTYRYSSEKVMSEKYYIKNIGEIKGTKVIEEVEKGVYAVRNIEKKKILKPKPLTYLEKRVMETSPKKTTIGAKGISMEGLSNKRFLYMTEEIREVRSIKSPFVFRSSKSLKSISKPSVDLAGISSLKPTGKKVVKPAPSIVGASPVVGLERITQKPKKVIGIKESVKSKEKELKKPKIFVLPLMSSLKPMSETKEKLKKKLKKKSPSEIPVKLPLKIPVKEKLKEKITESVRIKPKVKAIIPKQSQIRSPRLVQLISERGLGKIERVTKPVVGLKFGEEQIRRRKPMEIPTLSFLYRTKLTTRTTPPPPIIPELRPPPTKPPVSIFLPTGKFPVMRSKGEERKRKILYWEVHHQIPNIVKVLRIKK